MPPGLNDIFTMASSDALKEVFAGQIAGRMVELSKGLSPDFLKLLPDDIHEWTDLQVRRNFEPWLDTLGAPRVRSPKSGDILVPGGLYILQVKINVPLVFRLMLVWT